MASAAYGYQYSSPTTWLGDSKAKDGPPSKVVRSEELTTESDASSAAEQSIPSSFDGIIAKRKALQRVLAHVNPVASTDPTVLSEGETATGKEWISQAIHPLTRPR